jgi:hypothetical protein
MMGLKDARQRLSPITPPAPIKRAGRCSCFGSTRVCWMVGLPGPPTRSLSRSRRSNRRAGGYNTWGLLAMRSVPAATSCSAADSSAAG